jgi:flagellar basal body rod protein FlgG
MSGYAETALVKGMHFLAESQAAISNNLANLETASYKRRTPVALESASSFERVLGERMPTVRYGEVSDWKQGSLRETGSQLELALSEGSWLRVQDGKGRVFLTRDGQMQLDSQGGLVNNEGFRYLDQNGSPILLGTGEQSPTELSISNSGQISDPTTGQVWGPLGVFKVRDPNALVPVGSGNFQDPGKQKLEVVSDGVRQGYQEGSNVDSLQELVQMIVVQRSFTATQKALGSVGRMQESLVQNLSR